MRKVLILFAADALMWRQAGHPWGLEFFGFIALSMLVLAGLLRLDRHGAARSAWVAAGLLAGVLGLRFIAGPVAERFLGVAPDGWFNVITGRNVNLDRPTGISYPPIPWLVYPLAGFVLGAWLKHCRPWYLAHRASFVGVFALGALGLGTLTAFMLSRGFVMHRWGSMSVTSVVAGFAVMAALVALACAVEDLQGLARRVVDACSLRGIAAFSVVPLHYLVIAAGQALGWAPASPGVIALTLAVVVLVSMRLAPYFVPLGKWVAARPAVVPWWVAGALATAIAVVLVAPDAVASDAGRRAIGAVGQLMLCLMLVLPAVTRSRNVRESATATRPTAQSM